MISRKPILIVDDDPEFCNALGEVLEWSGHKVVTAHDGDDALRHLREGLVPALILLDLEMPRADGVSFRREQLADPALASIPVILHSCRPDLTQIAAQLRVAGHLRKTGDLGALLALVSAHGEPF